MVSTLEDLLAEGKNQRKWGQLLCKGRIVMDRFHEEFVH